MTKTPKHLEVLTQTVLPSIIVLLPKKENYKVNHEEVYFALFRFFGELLGVKEGPWDFELERLENALALGLQKHGRVKMVHRSLFQS